jgi:hypothetical protein
LASNYKTALKMKNIKRYGIKIWSLLSIVALLASGCTKRFDEYNISPTSISVLGPADYGKLFAFAEHSVYRGYQTAQNLHADMFSQYFSSTSLNFAEDRYVMNPAHLQSGLWNRAYIEVLPNLEVIIKNTELTSAENALAQIWRVFQYHRLTDYWGPIPYFSSGTDSKTYAYDPQDKIYYDMLKRLATAVDALKQNPTAKPFSTYDAIYRGDVSKWKKFANSLRLRLAMRISDVDPARAKAEAEAAVADGVMATVADDALLTVSAVGLDYNSFNNISGYNEFRMSATMESYLKGFNDPRLSKYYRPAVGTGTYEGIRNGLTTAQMSIPQNSYNNNSNVSLKYDPINRSTNPQDVMHAAESYFTRAEGALKGWNMGGTAQALYEQGIATSLNQWGITDPIQINAYINGLTPPAAPGDYFNSPPASNVPVKWGATDQIRKEQINTQLWLAVYPDGHEAWANQRRSDYPRLYPIINSENSDLPQGTFIKRVTYTTDERTVNGPAVQAAEALLPGGDKTSTPLWWDKY